jgi:sulfotransferase
MIGASVEKQTFFLAGLPRSGSTLLLNILGQNPGVHVTPTSGILDILVNTRNRWNKNVAFKAIPWEESERTLCQVQRHIMQGYFEHIEKPVCIDKNRGWLEFLEMASVVVGGQENVKVIVTVRDLRDVCASFEKLYRKTAATGQIPQEQADTRLKMKTAVGRLQIFISDGQPVGRAFNAVRDAVTRGWRKQMMFVEFGALTRQPKKTLDAVYSFLDLPAHEHDFDNVEQITHEDDSAHGFKDLHTIRRKVEPMEPQWSSVYDGTVFREPVWKRVEELSNFWREYVRQSSS